jgi:hypothetical protein
MVDENCKKGFRVDPIQLIYSPRVVHNAVVPCRTCRSDHSIHGVERWPGSLLPRFSLVVDYCAAVTVQKPQSCRLEGKRRLQNSNRDFSYVRTLISRPDLGREVEEVSLGTYDDEEYPAYRKKPVWGYRQRIEPTEESWQILE